MRHSCRRGREVRPPGSAVPEYMEKEKEEKKERGKSPEFASRITERTRSRYERKPPKGIKSAASSIVRLRGKRGRNREELTFLLPQGEARVSTRGREKYLTTRFPPAEKEGKREKKTSYILSSVPIQRRQPRGKGSCTSARGEKKKKRGPSLPIPAAVSQGGGGEAAMIFCSAGKKTRGDSPTSC